MQLALTKVHRFMAFNKYRDSFNGVKSVYFKQKHNLTDL